MKKTIKTLFIGTILTILFAFPVFAQEVTDPEQVISLQTFTANEDYLVNDFHKMEVWRCENYVKYLDGVIYNLNETVRIKQEIVDNYKWLSQYNPYYATLVPAAEKDLAEAKAWVDYYIAYKQAAQADLKARYKY